MKMTGSIRQRVIFIFLIGILFFSAIHLYLSYTSTEQSVINALRAQAIKMTAEISSKIDPDQYKRILAELNQTDDYWAVRDELNRIRKSIGAMYLVTLRIDENDQALYVVDGWDRDDPEASDIDQQSIVFDVNELKKVMAGQNYQTDLIDDPIYGEYFAVFVPIFDRDKTSVIGILEMDLSGEQVQKLVNEVWFVDLIYTILIDCLLLLFFAGVTIWFIRSFERLNQQLVIQNQELTDAKTTLEKQSTELAEQRDRLKDLNQLKDQILANTSHELRTPINGIIGLAESLMDGVAGPLNDLVKSNLHMIISSGKRLSNLVNDILDFSKLRKHTIELKLQDIKLYAAVQYACNMLKAATGKKEVQIINQISEATPVVVRVDENRLQQILHNLISNAVKFTERGHVRVSAEFENGMWAIEVADTGIGIEKDKIASVFEYFEQADGSIERNYGGTGLGLAITKQLVELHGGTIRIESTVGEGTRVIFTLPQGELNSVSSAENTQPVETFETQSSLSDTSATANIESVDGGEQSLQNSSASSSNASSAQPKKISQFGHILIVDDEPINIQVLENLLKMKGYDLSVAESGIKAIAMLKEGLQPDLILLDVMMPGLSGFDTAKQIRLKQSKEELPILMLTAKDTEEDIIKGFESGANDYLTKPLKKQELLARMNMHLDLTRTHRKLVVMKNRMKQLLDERSIQVKDES